MRILTYARFSLWIGLVTLTLGLAETANAQFAYDITPIGGVPEGLNNLGQVVGYYYPPNASLNRAFEYSNGQMQDLFPNDPSGGSANAINSNGNPVTVGLQYGSVLRATLYELEAYGPSTP